MIISNDARRLSKDFTIRVVLAVCMLLPGCGDILGLNVLVPKSSVDGGDVGKQDAMTSDDSGRTSNVDAATTSDAAVDASSTTLVISPASPGPLNVTGTASFTAAEVVNPGNVSTDVTDLVTWSTSDSTVLTMGADGLATPVLQGTTTSGTATVGATLTLANSTITATPVTVTVVNPPVQLAINAPSSDGGVSTGPYVMSTGGTLQFDVQAAYANGASGALTTGLTWTTSMPTYVTIDPSSGLASAVGSGTSIVGVSYTLGTTTVTAPPVPVGVGTKTYTVTYTHPAELLGEGSYGTTVVIGTYTVPSDFNAAVSMAVTMSGTTNNEDYALAYGYLQDSNGNTSFSVSPHNAVNNFSATGNFTPSSFPATFVAGATYNVVEAIFYTNWYIINYSTTFVLTYI